MSHINEVITELRSSGVPHKKLADIGTFKRGGGPQKKDFVEDGIGCIHYGQIYTHYGVSTRATNVFVSPDVARRSRMADPGDIVVAVTGENDEDLGKSVAWLGDAKVAVSNHTIIFTSPLDPKYVSYFLHSTSFHRQKQRHITGTKVGICLFVVAGVLGSIDDWRVDPGLLGWAGRGGSLLEAVRVSGARFV